MSHMYLRQGLCLFEGTCKTSDTEAMEIHILWTKSHSMMCLASHVVEKYIHCILRSYNQF